MTGLIDFGPWIVAKGIARRAVLGAVSNSRFIAHKPRDGAEYLASLGMTAYFKTEVGGIKDGHGGAVPLRCC
jgi:hypothetical protein